MGGTALLLVGSPRAESTSQVIGAYLLERLRPRGWETETYQATRLVASPERWAEFTAAVREAAVVIVSSPLYADSLPAPVITVFERLAREPWRKDAGDAPAPRLFVLVNNGFPEPHQNELALAICRQAAREVGFTWAGGLSVGAGGAINGQPLDRLGGMVAHLTRALDLAGAALAEDREVPAEATDLCRKSLLPGWLPLWLFAGIGNLGWWLQARPYGANWRLGRRPYWR